MRALCLWGIETGCLFQTSLSTAAELSHSHANLTTLVIPLWSKCWHIHLFSAGTSTPSAALEHYTHPKQEVAVACLRQEPPIYSLQRCYPGRAGSLWPCYQEGETARNSPPHILPAHPASASLFHCCPSPLLFLSHSGTSQGSQGWDDKIQLCWWWCQFWELAFPLLSGSGHQQHFQWKWTLSHFVPPVGWCSA